MNLTLQSWTEYQLFLIQSLYVAVTRVSLRGILYVIRNCIVYTEHISNKIMSRLLLSYDTLDHFRINCSIKPSKVHRCRTHELM